MPVVPCTLCNKPVGRGQKAGVKCVKCDQAYHATCGNISDEQYKSLSNGSSTWLCNKCQLSVRKSIIVCDDDIDPMKLPVNADLNDIISILKSMQQKLNKLDDLEKSQSFVCTSLDVLNETIKDLTKANTQANERLVELESKFSLQEAKLNLMEAQLDQHNQGEIKNNIVICGLPSDTIRNDDAIGQESCKVVLETLTKVDVNLKTDDIVSIKKMFHNKNSRSTLKNSFIVELKSTVTRNHILSTYNNKKKSTPNDVNGFNIIQHFTKFQSRLHKEAKKFQLDHKFQFLWCRNGKMFLRKSSSSEVHLIFSMNDIIRLQNGFRTYSNTSSSLD